MVDPSVYTNRANDEAASDPEPNGCPMKRNDGLLQSLQDIQPSLASRFDCPGHIGSPVCFASGKLDYRWHISESYDCRPTLGTTIP